MAKQRPSSQKRDREFRKRERDRRKREKAALKRARREGRLATDDEAPDRVSDSDQETTGDPVDQPPELNAKRTTE
jgi:hypothetical protein